MLSGRFRCIVCRVRSGWKQFVPRPARKTNGSRSMGMPPGKGPGRDLQIGQSRKYFLDICARHFKTIPYPPKDMPRRMTMDAFADLFLEAMHYEHWLRFYFLEDAEEAGHADAPMQSSPERELQMEEMNAILVVPAEAAARSREEEPALAEILEALQGQIISMEHSRDVIFDWLGERTGIRPGTAEFDARLGALAGDETFRRRLDFFHGWVQELANNEIDLQGNALPPGAPQDERIPSFAEWNRAFQFWFGMQKPFDLNRMDTKA